MVFVFPSENREEDFNVVYELEDTFNALKELGYRCETMKKRGKGFVFSEDIDKKEKIALVSHPLSEEEYFNVYAAFKRCGYTLINTPKQYVSMHYFCKELFDKLYSINLTPKFLIMPLNTPGDARKLQELDYRYIIKDNVKKLFGLRIPSHFDNTYASTEILDYVKQFRTAHDDNRDTNYVVKELMTKKKYQDESRLLELRPHSHEYNECRLWYIEGKLAFITDRTAGEVTNKNAVTKNLIKSIPILDSSFYTVDVVECLLDRHSKLTVWYILDVNDGQVSEINLKNVTVVNLEKGMKSIKLDLESPVNDNVQVKEATKKRGQKVKADTDSVGSQKVSTGNKLKSSEGVKLSKSKKYFKSRRKYGKA